MSEFRSFKDVIENRYYEAIYDAISGHLADNADSLGLRSNRVHKADEATLADLTIKWIEISDAPGDSIRFDVIAEAEIEVSEMVRRDREVGEASEWFRVSCKGELNNGLRNFAIMGVHTYSRRNSETGKMTDALVPVITKERFDAEAEAFLKAYYPEALTQPMAVDVREVARRMGLSIKEVHLSRHFTIFGEMVFADCEVGFYDKAERAYKPLPVSRGTILIDPEVYFLRNVGCRNNTIIHECVHWFKHRKHHELTGMYDSSAVRISCRVNEQSRSGRKWRPEDWMEWQANGIAPRILMPREMTARKIDELIAENTSIFGADGRLAVMERVLSELAEFYGVSRVAAKLRMLELGYHDVEGVAIFVDDHYISSYAFAADSKSRSQTFSICLSDSFFEYFANDEFRRLIDSGNFIYVDGHYAISDQKYVKKSPLGGLGLTDYAKLHIDECCIRFDLQYNKGSQNDIVDYLDTVEFRKAAPDYNRVPSYNADGHNAGVFARSEELKKFREEYADELTFLSRPVTTFAEAAWSHIQRLGLSRKVFCEKTLLSEKTYDRIKSNSTGRVTLQTVMQIAVGLELGGALGEQLIELAGYKLTAKEFGYKKVLYSYKGHSIYECDEVLRGLGLDSIIPRQYREAK